MEDKRTPEEIKEDRKKILSAVALITSATGVKKILSRLLIGGFTVKQNQSENLINTKKALFTAFKQSIDRGDSPQRTASAINLVVKRRLRMTLNTISNMMVGVRGKARAILNPGCRRWASISILDSGTTQVCQSHAGVRYKVLYREIPNKPPRTPPKHPCRSLLLPECNREPIQADTFAEWVNDEDNDEEVRIWLGPTRYEAFNSGKIKISRLIDLRGNKLFNVGELINKRLL